MNMNTIQHCIDIKDAKKIFSNKDNAINYLIKLSESFTAKELKKLPTNEVWSRVVSTWHYQKSKDIVRDLFRQSKKYTDGKNAAEVIDVLLTEWKRLNLGDVKWPCSQGDFDNFVQRINSQASTRTEKDDEVKIAAVRYGRMKELNTTRNDYLEYLLFEKNENIIPTLGHTRGTDFYIDGIAYDQKVGKSPTAQFIQKYGENWKQVAKENPAEVAKYLYTYQDEGRFGANRRLLIVYLDDDIPVTALKSKIDNIDISKPLWVEFTFDHEKTGAMLYKTQCFVILLSKD